MACSAKLKDRLETIVEIKSPAERYWSACKETTNLLPIIFSNVVKSVEYIVGDGKSIGSTMVIKYAEGYPIRSSTDRLDSTDDEKMTIKYSVIDGDLIGGFYTKFQPTLQIIPKENGCLAKWAVDYEKANEEVADPHVVVEFIIEVLHTLDEHVLKNN